MEKFLDETDETIAPNDTVHPLGAFLFLSLGVLPWLVAGNGESGVFLSVRGLFYFGRLSEDTEECYFVDWEGHGFIQCK